MRPVSVFANVYKVSDIDDVSELSFLKFQLGDGSLHTIGALLPLKRCCKQLPNTGNRASRQLTTSVLCDELFVACGDLHECYVLSVPVSFFLACRVPCRLRRS